MESYIENPFHHHQEQQQQSQQQQHQRNSGLSRFRSAPGSWLSNFDHHQLDKGTYNGNCNLSPEFAAENTGRGDGGMGGCGGGEGVETKPMIRVLHNGYLDSSELIIGQGHQLPTHKYAKHGGGGGVGGGDAVDGSLGSELQQMEGKVVDGGCNLVSQNSSPAGFFAHLSSQNASWIEGSIQVERMIWKSGKFSLGTGPDEKSILPRTSKQTTFKGVADFSFGLSSSAARLPRIPEIGNGNAKETVVDGSRFGSGDEDAPRFYNSGFSFSWDDCGSLVENGTEVKGDRCNERMLYSSGSDASFSLNGSRPHLLSHHLSLPKSSVEIAALEKILHFQDSVPCKIRAKRGCATHPRSIAERMRRSRISERIKKLQELVPNMEKQMNTSDMLDLALDYIKNLQEEYKRLSADRAKCRCNSSGQSSSLNQAS